MLRRMREILLGGNLRGLSGWLLLLLSATVDARSLVLEAERIEAGDLRADAVQLRLDWPAEAASGGFELEVARLQFDPLGLDLRSLRWRCPLQRDGQGWLCEGEANARGLRAGRLRLRIDDASREFALQRGGARLQLAQQAGQDGLTIESKAMPVDWLQPLLKTLWAEASLTAGTLDASLSLQWLDDATTIKGRLGARDFGLDTADGRIATAELAASGPLSLRWQGGQMMIDTELALRGGQLLVDPLYAELPAGEVTLALRGQGDQDGRWRFDRLHWRDPGVLDLSASASLQPGADDWLPALDLKLDVGDLAVAHPRYFDSLLGAWGAAGLTLAGGLQATVGRQADGWQVETALSALSLADAGERFAVEQADGRLAWSGGSRALDSRIRWQGAALYGIDFGAAEIALASADAGLRLREPLRIAALGGAIVLRRLAWWPAGDDVSPQLDLGMELVDLDLAMLSRRFDWPAFHGRLGGVIPAASYEDGVLRFDGGLQVALFDGRVEVASLRLERPFGVAPRLEADIAIDDLQLLPLTSVFGFGEISGRLDGRIAGLQLLDWRPVAFDAVFRTTDAGPRRISQRAVSDLTSIGGGGIAGGLQTSMLKMFDSFAYAQIGLSCRLAAGVCEMGGLDSSDGGYTIVQGAGLPRITVKGFQRRVDWAVLVSRLRAVSRGQAPTID
jgi:hypothetical protein